MSFVMLAGSTASLARCPTRTCPLWLSTRTQDPASSVGGGGTGWAAAWAMVAAARSARAGRILKADLMDEIDSLLQGQANAIDAGEPHALGEGVELGKARGGPGTHAEYRAAVRGR